MEELLENIEKGMTSGRLQGKNGKKYPAHPTIIMQAGTCMTSEVLAIFLS